MTRLFADSFYFFAILNANDEAHQKRWAATPGGPARSLQILGRKLCIAHYLPSRLRPRSPRRGSARLSAARLDGERPRASRSAARGRTHGVPESQ